MMNVLPGAQEAPTKPYAEVVEKEWVVFPGGELEGKRPNVMTRCRHRSAPTGALCFQCYRVTLDRDRALKAAAELDTATEERFDGLGPFAPVDRHRLQMLKAERMAAHAKIHPSVHRRRQAQIEARHLLSGIAAGLRARELRLPESWLPFVNVG